MTIQVLEVKVPEFQDHRSAQELLAHLRHLRPYAIFFLAAIPSTLRVGLAPTLALGVAFLPAFKRAR